MYAEFKITAWARVNIHEKEDFEKIVKFFKAKKFDCSDDIFEFTDEADYEVLVDSEEHISVEDNNGDATIEIFDDKYHLLYSNAEIIKEKI